MTSQFPHSFSLTHLPQKVKVPGYRKSHISMAQDNNDLLSLRAHVHRGQSRGSAPWCPHSGLQGELAPTAKIEPCHPDRWKEKQACEQMWNKALLVHHQLQ